MQSNILINSKFELKSFHPNFISLFSKSLKKIQKQNPWKKKILISNMTSFPKKTKVFTVLRSPHVDKKSREQFEIRTSKSIFYVTEVLNSSNTLDIVLTSFFSNLLKSKLTAGLGLSEVKEVSFIAETFDNN